MIGNFREGDCLGEKKKQLAIDRRRERELERRERIFDSKTRQIGIDKTALEKQIVEKKFREENEKHCNALTNEKSHRQFQIVRQLEELQTKENYTRNKELNEFRKSYQSIEFRKKLNENHPQFNEGLHLMGILGFEGEDLSYNDKVRSQKDQLRSWLDQQVAEKQEIINKSAQFDDYHLETLDLHCQQLMELEKMVKQCRHRIQQATQRYNIAVAKEKQMIQKAEEADDNMKYGTSDLLTENRENCINYLDENRIRPDCFRGFNDEYLQGIRQDQLRQIDEKHGVKGQEKEMERKLDDILMGLTNISILNEFELKKKKRSSALENCLILKYRDPECTRFVRMKFDPDLFVIPIIDFLVNNAIDELERWKEISKMWTSGSFVIKQVQGVIRTHFIRRSLSSKCVTKYNPKV